MQPCAEGVPLAVTAGKGLANKLGNSQERKHLGLRTSSDFPENVPKLYLANHTTKLFTDYTFFFFFKWCPTLDPQFKERMANTNKGNRSYGWKIQKATCKLSILI